MTENSSAIWTGYRPLGYVCNAVPLVTRYITRRKEHLIITATGRSFHTYGSAKLGLLSVSKLHPRPITALAADSYLVFVAAGAEIYAWRRGTELQRVYRGHGSEVHLLLPFGPKLISVEREGLLKVWDTKQAREELELSFNCDKTRVSALCHPSTYLDKILVGSSQGHIQLWNIKTVKLIYTFPGWESGVTCLEQAPAIDVVAVGLENGAIYLHNMKYDETVIKFSQEWGAVTGVSFRTDGLPVMLTGSTAGHLACWDLQERKLSHQLRGCHSGTVSGLRCLPGEPLAVTSGPDNVLKQWIFDMSDGGARLLRVREGHSAPPARVRYYGGAGDSILSAGQDSSLRVFSTVADLLNRSLGHASFNRKLSKKHRVAEDPVRMPAITEFTSDTSRDREWDNIACIHRGQGLATTWSFGLGKQGALQLLHPRFKQEEELRTATATCLALTACGNFVLLGYSSGHIDRFNIQSGLHRAAYCHGTKPAHRNSLRGLGVDGLNQQVVSGDSRGVVKFWRFKEASLLHKLELGAALSLLRLHRESGLLALAMEDYSVRLVELETRTVVRRLPGHSAPITDLAFSPDSRWLVTVSLDSTGRVWDLPTGHCVDYVLFDSPATSVDLSPSSDMMATSHTGDLGVYLWLNKTLYQQTTLAPVSRQAKPVRLSLPANLTVDGVMEEEAAGLECEEPDLVFASPDQISEQLITLANLPGSRWLNLLQIDVIKKKNKPKAPPKKPKAAPFFLPTISGLETKFDLSNLKPADDDGKDTSSHAFSNLTEFGAALDRADTEQEFLNLITSFMEKGPSAIDIEIRSLGPEGGGTLASLEKFMQMLKIGMKSNRNYEALEAYCGLFLKVHGDIISTETDLIETLKEVQKEQESRWTAFQEEMDSSLCLVKFFKSSFLK